MIAFASSGSRKKLVGAVLTFLVFLIILPLSCSPAEPLAPGDSIPDLLMVPSDSTVVGLVWVFRPEDCLECVRFLRKLRRALALDKSLRFFAIQVNGQDSVHELVSAFFRRERLAPLIRTIDEGTYRKGFGRSPLPSLYLIYNNIIINPDYGPEFNDPITDAMAWKKLGRAEGP